MKRITVALAGNPNSGKTTIFNMLTGLHQHVGNYPGVTVEKKEGARRYEDYEINFVDLPGTYSLTAYSEEELVARNFIIDQRPDVVVDVIDASNIERNLYLATQFMEMNVPLVLAFNMSDIARQNGLVVDIPQLSRLLEATIVPTVGSKQQGTEELLAAIVQTAEKSRTGRIHTINYGQEIEEELAKIERLINDKQPQSAPGYNSRWLGVKLLERDKEIAEKLMDSEICDAARRSIEHLKSIFRDEPEIVLADRRYGFISGACQETIQTTVELRHNVSDIIDTVVLNPVLGLPIFLLLMLAVFVLTFKAAQYPMDWLGMFFGWIAAEIGGFWPADSNSLLRSLLLDGIIGGVGGVLVFLPNIMMLFLAIAFLEYSGYMARAAFVMDRLMHKIGLHGKSFIPMLIGFGCSVPAIMATRILENRRNRLTTIMVIPLMSCGGRLAIYALFIPAFFSPQWQGAMLWLIYIIGIVLAVGYAKLLRLSVFRGETVPFVMELPPYRMPTLKAVGIHMWERAQMYLRKAGTVILAASVVLWAGMNFPQPRRGSLQGLSAQQVHKVRLENSLVGRVGKAIEPAIRPLGFDWKIGTALIGAAAAKELFVSQLAIIYAQENHEHAEKSLSRKLQANYTPLTAFCTMLFCLIYAPCAATVAVTRYETASWAWALFQFVTLTALAYVVTLIVNQIGLLIGG